ncbi:MAG TPA: PVC-type heme-binding CxxCH protein [Vicinamibacterales bacterium]|nr:PVC-type heme-binding CxxCH protein [Vicinamibacterales bacterium]
MARFFYHTLPVVLVLATVVGGAQGPAPTAEDGPPYSPADSMRTLAVEPGFRVELVASEPNVQSPVAIDIDENGRMFVVEMPGYPVDVSPSGRIKLLEDLDGDGRFERTTLFADGLVLPTGVMRWKRGILVTAAPDVLYLEDTDGDGRADVRRTVITGFPFTNPQHTVNSPVYGLDNWVYVANQGPTRAVIYKDLFGDRGTEVSFPDRPASRIPPPSTTVRFRPDTFEIEALAGESQFGHTFDAYGRYFGNDNSHHLWHEVIESRYLERNPHLLVRRTMHDVPDHGAAAAVYPITRRPTFELLTEAGEFTSACAPAFYLGAAFPSEYDNSVFVAEPVHNLVHRDVIAPLGATFTARRGESGREFLAAGDAWFRPVFLYVGPDGALYVVDYYRARIEHPEWTSSDLQRDPAPLFEGRDRGRIYRIVHESMDGRPRRVPRLRDASVEALVAALADPNVWWRRTAQRLLVDKREGAAVPALTAMARERVSPLARLHALWTLHGMGALDRSLVLDALGDPDPGVRENAVILAELDGGIEDLDARLAAMARDADPRVRFRVLAALGGINTPTATAAHERLLFDHLDDPWMQIAGLSAGPGRARRFLERAIDASGEQQPSASESRMKFVRLAASVVARGSRPDDIERLVRLTAAGEGSAGAPWRAGVLRGLTDGLGGKSGARDLLSTHRADLLRLAADDDAEVRGAALELLRQSGGVGTGDAARRALQDAERTALDASRDAGRRAHAIALLGLDGSAERTPLLRSLIDPRQPDAVQAAAVEALGRRRDPELGSFLISSWTNLTPPVRSAATDALLRSASGARLLVSALHDGTVRPWTLGFWQKRDLLMHEDREIRDAARAVLEEDPRRREETIERYARALSAAGDPVRGEQVFTRACAPCHSIGGGAGDLGPDLATVRHRPALLLLADILVPSRSIAQGYETWSIARASGGSVTGLLAGQTPTSVTLRQGSGQAVTIAREDIRAMTALPESSMPADLDKVITPEEMADLLAFLKHGRTAAE